MWRRLPIARVQLLCPVWVGLILLRGLVPTLGSTASLLLDTPKFTSGMDTPLSDISYHCTEEAGVVSSSVSSSRFVSPGPAPIRNGPKGEGSARSQKALPGCLYHRGTVERAMVQNWLFFLASFIWGCYIVDVKFKFDDCQVMFFILGQQHICLCFHVFINISNYCYFYW